ncbi:hypothetical protein ACEW2I_005180, partial [Escherichia coli]
DAVLVATTPGQVYGDPVDPGWSGFYWIRFVNAAGVKGPWHAVGGVAAQTQISVQALIDQIKEEAANSPVVEELRKEIRDAKGRAVEEAVIQTTEVVGDLREETLRTIGGVETRISSLGGSIDAFDTRITRLDSSLDEFDTRMGMLDNATNKSLNEVNKRINKLDKEGGEAFLAMWSKKTGVEG